MTTPMAPPTARKERPRTRVGRPFQPGNPGKPKGARDRRTVVGIEAARAMSGRAFDRLAALIDSRSHRVALEASRLVLAYAWGAPRQTLELTGDFGDLSRELAAALIEARARRAALETVVPSTAIVAAPSAITEALAAPAPELEAEVVKAETEVAS